MAMNTEQQVSYSIEGIRERRLAKREELKLSKERMQDLTQQLFAPQQGKKQDRQLDAAGEYGNRCIRRAHDWYKDTASGT